MNTGCGVNKSGSQKGGVCKTLECEVLGSWLFRGLLMGKVPVTPEGKGSPERTQEAQGPILNGPPDRGRRSV